MTAQSLMQFRQVSFSYDGAGALFTGLDLDLHDGFTGCVGANGAGKTTLMKLAVGELSPTRGRVTGGGLRRYCPQRTDEPPEDLKAFLDASDPDACTLRGKLRLESDWASRWTTLSHGERKRCQIGTAVWSAPDILAIDEPTNHIDAAGRHLLVTALGEFSGIGLLVSHDRELLDALCRHCVWLEPPSVTLHRGGYTQAAERRRLDAERDRAAYDQARAQRDRLNRELRRRKEEASRSHRERSKRGIAVKDHDARFRKNAARVSGKDAQAGRLYRQLIGRTEQAEQRLQGVVRHKEHARGVTIAAARSSRDLVVDLGAGALSLGPRRLRFESLRMAPTSRVAVTGPNGAGKSTLLRHLIETSRLPESDVLFLPQEVDAATATRLLAEAKRLPRDELGRTMTLISRLGSRPGRLLESACPSPGELRKLLIAMGLARAPHLIVLDEPTNHLDLPSIENVEEALADCDCAVLLVSHDETFLRRLTTERWEVVPERTGDSFVRVS